MNFSDLFHDVFTSAHDQMLYQLYNGVIGDKGEFPSFVDKESEKSPIKTYEKDGQQYEIFELNADFDGDVLNTMAEN